MILKWQHDNVACLRCWSVAVVSPPVFEGFRNSLRLEWQDEQRQRAELNKSIALAKVAMRKVKQNLDCSIRCLHQESDAGQPSDALVFSASFRRLDASFLWLQAAEIVQTARAQGEAPLLEPLLIEVTNIVICNAPWNKRGLLKGATKY